MQALRWVMAIVNQRSRAAPNGQASAHQRCRNLPLRICATCNHTLVQRPALARLQSAGRHPRTPQPPPDRSRSRAWRPQALSGRVHCSQHNCCRSRASSHEGRQEAATQIGRCKPAAQSGGAGSRLPGWRRLAAWRLARRTQMQGWARCSHALLSASPAPCDHSAAARAAMLAALQHAAWGPLASGSATALLRAGAAGLLLQSGRVTPAMGPARGPAAGGGAAGFATAAGETDPSRLRNFAIIGGVPGCGLDCASGPEYCGACSGRCVPAAGRPQAAATAQPPDVDRPPPSSAALLLLLTTNSTRGPRQDDAHGPPALLLRRHAEARAGADACRGCRCCCKPWRCC